jgi:hypothetical protein
MVQMSPYGSESHRSRSKLLADAVGLHGPLPTIRAEELARVVDSSALFANDLGPRRGRKCDRSAPSSR